MTSAQRVNFEIAFPGNPDPVVLVWETLVAFLDENRCIPKTFRLSQIAGHLERYHTTDRLELSADGVARVIAKRNLRGFSVDAGKDPHCISYWLHNAKELGDQSTLRAQIDDEAKSPAKWNSLIERLMALYPCVGAWQWNVAYEAWQNATELHAYYAKFYGEPPSTAQRFVIKSVDGIGPDREFIDVSSNPGRTKTLIPQLSFYPAAEMWLGPHFWQYAACTKADVLAADLFIEKRDTPHFVYLKCWPEPFTRPDGEQGRIQQRLWRLFFDEDCEWPPGTGSISQ